MMDGFDIIFARKLREEMQQDMQVIENVILDDKCDDFPDYRFYVGKLKGYRDVLLLARSVEQSILGMDKPQDQN